MTVISSPDPSWFRFTMQQLEDLCDGQWHELRAGVHFPHGLPLANVRARLRSAARYRSLSVVTKVPVPGVIVVRFSNPFEFPGQA